MSAEVVGHDLHRHDVGAGLLGQVGQQRAGRSSASRRETRVEIGQDGGAHVPAA